MIRLLTPRDNDIALSYLDRDPLHNIYMIFGLQTCGLASSHITFWGAFRADQLEGVLFADNDSRPRYGCLAGDNPQVLAQLARLAPGSGIRKLLGKREYVQPAIEGLHSKAQINVQHFHFYRLVPEEMIRFSDYPVRVATEDEIPLLVELYRHYDFRGPNTTDEDLEREIRRAMNGSGRYYFIELEGRAVSVARVFPETDRAGMVDAATTLPELRGRGMYLSVRTACCESLFHKGKIAVGFFRETNDSMVRVVAKQGGTIIGKWLVADFIKKPPLRRRILPRRLRRWAVRVRDEIWRQ